MNVNVLKEFPLLIRMILLTALCSLILTICITTIEITITYNRKMVELEKAFQLIKETQVSSLSENLWQFDTRAVDIQLQGILNSNGVSAVSIDGLDDMIFSVGDTAFVNPIHRNYPILKKNDTQIDTIGVLHLYGTNKLIIKELIEELPIVITSELLKILGIVAIIMLLFFRFFHRHLQKIVSFTDSVTLSNIGTHLTLSRRKTDNDDELDRLVSAINNYGERIANGFENLRQAEELLRSSEEMYRHVYNAPDEAIFIHDGETGAILDVNAAAVELYGYPKDEFLSLSISDLSSGTPPYSQENARIHVINAVDTGSTTFNWRAKKNTDELFWVNVTLRRVMVQDQMRVIAFVRDVTEQNRLEENLRQSQKMEAIGTLAGGVAHDFNNILSGIVGFSELALIEAEKSAFATTEEYIGEVLKASDRAKGLVEQILIFSRKSSKEKSSVEFASVVQESLKLLRSSIPTTINFVVSLKSESKILADPTQIHQIVMNLCTNAYHAMRESGGTLTVTLSEVEISSENQTIGDQLSEGSYIRLSISDTGIGMDSTTIKRIFDPYFTTKKEGEGTGLGLAMVHGIVKDHGGDITVYSELGRGTTFNIYMPKQTIGGKALTRKKSVSAETLRGTESVLFVDDEEVIRRLGERVFAKNGYAVTVCENGLDAWELFSQNPQAFDIVVTDITMPLMTGIELTRAIHSISPDFPVIVCSGFTLQMNETVLETENIFRFLQKPVVINSLLTAVREAIDTKKGKG